MSQTIAAGLQQKLIDAAQFLDQMLHFMYTSCPALFSKIKYATLLSAFGSSKI